MHGFVDTLRFYLFIYLPVLSQLLDYLASEPKFLLRICTHTQTITISSDLCPPTMLFKLRPCIQKQCNVYYPPTPSLDWIGQIIGRSLSLASLQLFCDASVERSSLRNAHSSMHSVSSRSATWQHFIIHRLRT
jgi:hypothetical protein